MRLTTALLIAVAASACSALTPAPDLEVRCLELSTATCDEAWALVEGELSSDRGFGQLADIAVGKAEDCDAGCMEGVLVTVSYDSGGQALAFLQQEADGLVLGPAGVQLKSP